MNYINMFLMMVAILGSSPSLASSGGLGVMTYHGRIVLANGAPLVASSVTFRVQIRSPGSENCLLYEEDHTLDMSKSDGVFALNIGAGTSTDASSLPLNSVFSNKGANVSGLSCTVGSSYIPNASDSRRLVISFNDGSGYQTLQVQQVNSVPFSLESQQIGGYSATNLLRVENGIATPFNQAQFNELLDLISGHSTQYTKSGQFLNGSLPTDMSPNETVKWDGQKWVPHVLHGSASGTLTGITAGTGLMADGVNGGQISVSGTLALTDTGVVAATYGDGASVPSFQVDAQGRINSVTNIPISSAEAFSGDLEGDVSGKQGATSVDRLKGVSVSASPPLSGQFLKLDSSTWTPNFISVTDIKSAINPALGVFPKNCSTSQTLQYDSLNDTFTCANITVSSFSGALSGDVTGAQANTVVSSVGGVSAAQVAAGANLANQATSTNVSDTVVRRDVSGNFTAGTITANLNGHANTATSFIGLLNGDITGTQGATSVAKIKGHPVAEGDPTGDGNTLRWMGTYYAPSFLSLADIRNATADQQFPTNCNTEQTMVYNSLYDKYECQNITLMSTTNILNGDVVGSVSNNNVVAMQGRPVSVNAPFPNQVLKWDGMQWLPSNEDGMTGRSAGGDLTGSYPSPSIAAGVITASKIANDTIVNANINANAAIADTKLATISSAGKVANSATTGTNSNVGNAIVLRDASGDFSAGTITANLNGNAATATTALTANSATTAATATNFTGSLSGDVTGTQSSTTVLRIQGRNVASAAPGVGQVLKWSGTQWEPGNDLDTNSGGTLTGSGTAGYIPVWVNGSAQGNSIITADASATYTNGRNVVLGGSDSGYSTAPIEVRVATPRVSFHWPGVVASQIGMDSAGVIRTFDNPGSGYAPFAAGSITSNGETYTTGWYRSYGTNMVYNETYAIGWSPNAGSMNVYGTARIGNVQSPIYASDAATKGYVDSAVGNIFAGNVGIGVASPSERLEVAGNVKAVSFISTSDQRLKKDIRPIAGLEAILRLKGYQYRWIANDEADAGVLAQEVEKVFPGAVRTDEKTGYKGVKYQYLMAPMIEATKEVYGLCKKTESAVEDQQRKIASLQGEVRELRDENESLKKRLEKIEALLGVK